MGQALAVVILLIIAAALYNKFKDQIGNIKRSKGGQVIDISEAWIPADNLPYRRKEAIFGPDENALFQLLTSILPPDYYLLPRVRLADLLYLSANVENRQAYQSRIDDRSVDFVICSVPQLHPVLVLFVENDAEARKKQLRESFIKRALETAGMPIVNLKLNPVPDKEMLIRQLNNWGIS